MTLTIKNKKLFFLAILFFAVFFSLGKWQTYRAESKEKRLSLFAKRATQAPLSASAINQLVDTRFYRVLLSGTFDNAHHLLLDNKTHEGRIGYELYTPFQAVGLKSSILVDRGFIPLGNSRKDLPIIKQVTGTVTLQGFLSPPPNYFALGQMKESSHVTFPLRIEFIDLSELKLLLGYPLFSAILLPQQKDSTLYPMTWQVNIISPERHRGYAVQWFALAYTLLILCVALSFRDSH